ncbi:MAG: DUF3579 domain-containing protein [Burkholderiales bacterium]|nr:DUF3579 domain-containing protein [Burkholderiales bacterium]
MPSLDLTPDEWLIVGLTHDGRKFRPSDWGERLCGALSSFDRTGRLAYSRHARPVTRDGQECVVVETLLEEINPDAYQFLMDFARDNQLQVRPGRGKLRLGDSSARKLF